MAAKGRHVMEHDDKLSKQRVWGSEGNSPEHWWEHYSQGQRAVINVIYDQIQSRGRCTLSHAHVMEVAGVGKWTIQAAIRTAVRLGHLQKVPRPEGGLSNEIILGKTVSG